MWGKRLLIAHLSRRRAPRYYSSEAFSKALHPSLVSELKLNGIVSPSEVQQKAIEPILSGKSCIIASPTGTGKTLSYLAPLIELLRREDADLRENRPAALVVVPSRELCVQVLVEAKKLTKAVGKLKAEALIGGMQWKKKTFRSVINQKVNEFS
jgi:superfamily II DNA/RNA helicase